MVKTKKELEKVSDRYLIEIYEEAKGYEDDYKNHFCTEYTYNDIIKELESRGYQQKWINTEDELDK